MTDRLITSLTNETVKAVRALHMRKEREATGTFLAEGLKFIGEALDQGRAPRMLLVGQDARPHPLLDRARAETTKTGGEIVVVTHAILEKISRRDNPQTVLGVFDQAYAPLDSLVPASAPCWVALEQVRDPGNLGTIIRTADAAGCGGVILIDDCVYHSHRRGRFPGLATILARQRRRHAAGRHGQPPLGRDAAAVADSDGQ
jgi:TrmH family RNA methyltransferase